MSERVAFILKIIQGHHVDLTANDAPYRGTTACLIPESTAEVVQSQLGTVSHIDADLTVLSQAYRIGPSDCGLGLFAARNLTTAELILVEKPFTVTPTRFPLANISQRLSGLSRGERENVIMNEWETSYLWPMVASLDLTDQEDYLSLANVHVDEGVPSLLGIIRTNGLDIGELPQDTERQDGVEYAAVCKTMSRVNHSCRPNAERVFDLPSFTFRLRALRDISEGEEITIAYCGILQRMETRQKALEYWKFRCKCPSCVGNTAASDSRRFQIWESTKILEDPSDIVPAQQRIEYSLKCISIVREEGLEGSDAYRCHLEALSKAYNEMRDEKNSAKFRTLFEKCSLAHCGA